LKNVSISSSGSGDDFGAAGKNPKFCSLILFLPVWRGAPRLSVASSIIVFPAPKGEPGPPL